jgi:hypothetical protein
MTDRMQAPTLPRRGTCPETGKIQFENEQAATWAKYQLQGRGETGLRVYPTCRCGFWHVGHITKRDRAKDKQADDKWARIRASCVPASSGFRS